MGLKELCRTCLCSVGVMFPLFDEMKEKLAKTGFDSAIEVLETFTFVPIHNKDYLPDRICGACLREIQRAYLFMLKCEKSERILNQLKKVKVNLKKTKKIPDRHEFESESHKLIVVKEEPEEILDFYDTDNLVLKDIAIKSELKFNRMSTDNQLEHEPDYQVFFKNEPELDIEELISSDNECKTDVQLKCSACEKEFRTVDLFRGHTITDHIDERLCKLCNEEFDCSQFEHSAKHLPSNYLNETIHKKPSDLSEDLKKQTENFRITEKYCQQCSKHFTDLEMLKLHVCRTMSVNRSDYDKDITMEYIEQSSEEPKIANELTDPKSKHQCSFCSKSFSYKYGLTMHMRIHTGETPFKCNFCSEQFRLRPALRVHMETKHLNETPDGKPKFQCTICSKILASSNHLVAHVRIHTGEKPFQCEWCSEKFRYKSSMVTHSQMIHTEELANQSPKYQCCICSENFRYESDLATHIRSHANEKQKFQINATKKKRIDKVTYDCEVCSKSFSFKSQLIRHQICHTDDKPFQCKTCLEKFRQRSSLRVHMETEHINELAIEKPRIQCTICSKVFAYNCNLNKHMRMHTIAKRQCEICFEKFRHLRLLAIHMETKHPSERPDAASRNQCSICWKSFSNSYSLMVHMRGHTGEKPYQCKLCNATFRYKHLLRVHMEDKHINEMPGDQKPKYQCNVCSKIFTFNNNLVSHMRSHTGEKPFQCEVCTEKFRYQESLFKHMQMKHYKEMIGNEPNYQCTVCWKTYGYRMTLKIHMQTVHGKELPE